MSPLYKAQLVQVAKVHIHEAKKVIQMHPKAGVPGETLRRVFFCFLDVHVLGRLRMPATMAHEQSVRDCCCGCRGSPTGSEAVQPILLGIKPYGFQLLPNELSSS